MQRSNLKPLEIGNEWVKSTPNNLQLIIHDNGKGFKPNQNTTGFGLQSMRDRFAHALRAYRALTVGGTLNVETAPNAGCKITADFPI